MQNGGDFVYVILLHIGPLIQLIRAFVIGGYHTCWYHGMSAKVVQLHISGLSQRRAADRVCASGGFCDHLARSRFSVGVLDRRADAELMPRLHVASLASHTSLLAITLLPSQYFSAFFLSFLLTYLFNEEESFLRS